MEQLESEISLIRNCLTDLLTKELTTYVRHSMHVDPLWEASNASVPVPVAARSEA